MDTHLDLRKLSSKELADRADALEEEAALVRALVRVRRKQEEERAELVRAITAADAAEKETVSV